MKLVFLSNFMNHHQKPLCDALYSRLGNDFVFVSTQTLPDERKVMRYKDYSGACAYELQSYRSEKDYKTALKVAYKSDVVILGAAPDEFIVERMKENKLTFRYSERYFKQGKWKIFDPRVLKARYQHDIRYRNKNLYMLCASAYTAQDCRLIHAYPNKTYKWGYFPEVKKYDDIEKIIRLKHPASILWVGRLIRWKHPEDSIRVAERLKQNGYPVELNIIGEGDQELVLRTLIKKKGLTDCVHLHGFMAPEKVREWMEKADIYLFTSDRNEGWGAVLNESMNSACAVVACDEIGSVPYLIRNSENGFTYNRHKKEDLYNKVKYLLDHEDEKYRVQRNAYFTMTNLWNADVAVDRLIELIKSFIQGKDTKYMDGPCSKDF